MGMDVYGKNADDARGEYFRANVWWWRPIPEIISMIAPEIYAKCEHWGSNDGDGLDGESAKALADIIDRKIEDGSLQAIIDARQAVLNELPDDECRLCNSTGIRTDAIGVKQGMPSEIVDSADIAPGRPNPRAGQVGSCNACHGAGFVRPWGSLYPTTIEVWKEWSVFCRHCGGFEIC